MSAFKHNNNVLALNHFQVSIAKNVFIDNFIFFLNANHTLIYFPPTELTMIQFIHVVHVIRDLKCL